MGAYFSKDIHTVDIYKIPINEVPQVLKKYKESGLRRELELIGTLTTRYDAARRAGLGMTEEDDAFVAKGKELEPLIRNELIRRDPALAAPAAPAAGGRRRKTRRRLRTSRR